MRKPALRKEDKWTFTQKLRTTNSWQRSPIHQIVDNYKHEVVYTIYVVGVVRENSAVEKLYMPSHTFG